MGPLFVSYLLFGLPDLLEPLKRFVRAAGVALYYLYLLFGFQFVEGVTDLSFVFPEYAVPVGGRVQDAVWYSTEDFEDLRFRSFH